MSYLVSDLRPANPILSIGDRYFSISLITLHIESLIKAEFGELNTIHEKINKKPLMVLDIIWALLLDKSEFTDKKAFIDFVLANTKTSEVGERLYNCFYDSFKLSMPKIKNKARYDELLKISQSQESAKICYGVYYDKLAKRYGYTINDFFNLTLGQLHLLLTVSSDQQYEEIEVQAMLQGKKMKPRMTLPDIDEKEDSKLDEDAKEMLARLKKDYANGK